MVRSSIYLVDGLVCFDPCIGQQEPLCRGVKFEEYPVVPGQKEVKAIARNKSERAPSKLELPMEVDVGTIPRSMEYWKSEREASYVMLSSI